MFVNSLFYKELTPYKRFFSGGSGRGTIITNRAMLETITHTVNIVAMSISLWMSFYLFARGYPNRTAMLVSLALMAVGAFFLDTYNQYFSLQNETANLRAALLVIAFACWHGAIYTLSQTNPWKRRILPQIFIPMLAAGTVLMLVFGGIEIISDRDNILLTARLGWNLGGILYGFTLLIISAGILYAVLSDRRIRSTAQGKYIFTASLFLILALAYGVFALSTPAPMPRVIEDGLVFGGIFLLGLSVARHQSLVERRTIRQDFWVSLAGVFVITCLYLGITIAADIPARLLGNIAAFVITTHALYDMGREAVERWNLRREKHLRRRTSPAARLEDEALRIHLEGELALLLEALNSSSGLIAAREDSQWVVLVSRESLRTGAILPDNIPAEEAVTRAPLPRAANLAWIAQAFEGMEPVALVGVGDSQAKLKYSSGELELLEEVTEQIGTLISMSALHKQAMQSAATRVVDRLSGNVDADYFKSVEDALRHYPDTLYLGQSPLAGRITPPGLAQIEQGKQLQRMLHEAVQSLRPEGERPPEPLPREWYNYVILYDAYLKGVPNREVTARLYISEGTFHRARRQAIRGIAHWLMERKNRFRDSSFVSTFRFLR